MSSEQGQRRGIFGSGKLRQSLNGSRLFRRSGLRGSGLRGSGLRRRSGEGAERKSPAEFIYSDHKFLNKFDPVLLLKGLDPVVSGVICIRKGGGINGVRSTWESFFAELRGTTVLLFNVQDGEWAEASTNPPIQALFSVVGCEVKEKVRGDYLILSKPNFFSTLHLRFPGGQEACMQWERFLTAAATQLRLGLKDFEVLKPIGQGASGKVFLVRDRRTGELLALKSMSKDLVFKNKSSFRHSIDERLMLEVCHGQRFFIQLKYAFQTFRKIYLVTEFCEGGDLFYYLKTRGGRIGEDQTRRVAAETILALEFMHSRGIVYRDLKPENVLLDRQGHLKLADFGLCKTLERNCLTATIVGTHTYAAPEMLGRRDYGASIDVWTLGIFIYHIWRGRTPYDGKDVNSVVENMNLRAVRFPRDASSEMIDLITSLLERKPEKRLGAGVNGISEVKLHPFFKTVEWTSVQACQPHADNLQVSMEAEPGGVPNFDLDEWRDVTLDDDELHGEAWDDYSLWPLQRVGRHDLPDLLLVGYQFNHEFATACKRLLTDQQL